MERLHGISGRLSPGRLTALIGPNGSGKSTLVKCLAGILPPRSGSILYSGRNYREISRKQLAQRVSCMPQSRPVPEMTVRQLAEQGRYPHLGWGKNPSRTDRMIVERALARTGADTFSDRSIAELSGGERQRAYLAMMLAQDTPVMLLDEPTAYLDPGGQFQLMDMLAGLAREGKTVAVVLHDLALALEYAHEILLMQEGRIAAAGSPEAIFASNQLDKVFGVRTSRTSEGKYVFSRGNDI